MGWHKCLPELNCTVFLIRTTYIEEKQTSRHPAAQQAAIASLTCLLHCSYITCRNTTSSYFLIWADCEGTIAGQIPVNVEYEDDEIMDNIMPPDISGLSLFVRFHGELMSADMTVVEKALKEMADLCTLSNANREANCQGIVKAFGCSMIFSAMIKWYTNPDIQTAGCEVLANATYEPSDITIKTQIIDVQGASVVVTAKRNYPNNTELQRFASTVLMNLKNEGNI